MLWLLQSGIQAKRPGNEVKLESQQVLGHGLLGCHMRYPGQREDLMWPTSLHQGSGQSEGVGDHHVVVSQAMNK